MNKRGWQRSWILLMAVAMSLVIVSCGSNKGVKKPKRMASAKKLPVLLDSLRQNEFDCEWLTLKLGVAFETEKLSDSFKMFIRMRKDSVIWMQATYYAVEVARFYLTPDSVKFMDRKNKGYYIGTYDFFRDQYKLDFDFDMLQSLLMGNSIGLNNETSDMRASVDQEFHRLSNYRKRRMKRAVEKDKNSRMDEIAYSVWVDAENYKVAKLSVNDFKESRSVLALFSDFKEVAGQLMPHKTKLDVTDHGTETAVTTTYLRVQVNKPANLTFNIPDKYERIL